MLEKRKVVRFGDGEYRAWVVGCREAGSRRTFATPCDELPTVFEEGTGHLEEFFGLVHLGELRI